MFVSPEKLSILSALMFAPKSLPSSNQVWRLKRSWNNFVISFVFSNCILLVRVTVGPGTLGTRWSHTNNKSPVHHRAPHIHIHTFVLVLILYCMYLYLYTVSVCQFICFICWSGFLFISQSLLISKSIKKFCPKSGHKNL